MTPPAISFFVGRTAHTREQPFRRSFQHRVAMIEIDIDRLPEADQAARFFSVGKGNAISFRETDHGARDAGVSLRVWAEARFAAAGVTLNGGSIRLLTFPRVLGYGFAPISIWLGFSDEGALRGVIYEVHNTFGETHCYVSAFETDVQPTATKEFFVSPFFEISGSYRFTLRPAAERLDLMVENVDAQGRTHVASLLVQRRPFTDGAIVKWLTMMPFSGLGVTLAIHWQALILLIKGARYIQKPVQRFERTTIAGKVPPAERPRKRA